MISCSRSNASSRSAARGKLKGDVDGTEKTGISGGSVEESQILITPDPFSFADRAQQISKNIKSKLFLPLSLAALLLVAPDPDPAGSIGQL